MGSLGPIEIGLIFLVILLVFGAKRIPEIARGLGKGIREFKTATKEISKEFDVNDRSNQIQAPGRPKYGTPAPRTDVSQQTVPAAAPPPAEQQTVPAAAPPPAEQQTAPAAAPPPAEQPPTSPPPDPDRGP